MYINHKVYNDLVFKTILKYLNYFQKKIFIDIAITEFIQNNIIIKFSHKTSKILQYYFFNFTSKSKRINHE